jgi:hypothetical protein
MATARSIINPKNAGSIKFADNSAGIPAAVEQGFQIMDFGVIPKPNMSTAAGTYGAPPSDVPGLSSYGLVIAYFQDWGITDSLSEYLFTNDGVLKFFRIDPANAGIKGMEGQVYIVAGKYAGLAGGNWIDTATMPCPVKPTLLTAT